MFKSSDFLWEISLRLRYFVIEVAHLAPDSPISHPKSSYTQSHICTERSNIYYSRCFTHAHTLTSIRTKSMDMNIAIVCRPAKSQNPHGIRKRIAVHILVVRYRNVMCKLLSRLICECVVYEMNGFIAPQRGSSNHSFYRLWMVRMPHLICRALLACKTIALSSNWWNFTTFFHK